MTKEIIHTWNKEKIILIISDDGYCNCPVCGVKAIYKDWRPYDTEGNPSYDICSCGFEYGFDDSGVPPYDKSWERYRDEWLLGEIENERPPRLTLLEKKEQLKNIGVEIIQGSSRKEKRNISKNKHR
ncbi:hypothetical protein [Dokdonia sp.]|uniref:hypothetical protein n=1 Tax=Dokdonia sp. TaxID=2024995 RepID=UPI003266247A